MALGLDQTDLRVSLAGDTNDTRLEPKGDVWEPMTLAPRERRS